MSVGIILAFVGAALSACMALGILVGRQRSLAHALFAAGALLLAAESLCVGLELHARVLEEVLTWERWRLTAMSLLPACWFGFSLVYARGNFEQNLRKWQPVLVALLVLPALLALAFRDDLLRPETVEGPPSRVILRLGPVAVVLTLIFLLSGVLVLMNLERTYRAAVGTMRWRIKFMVLGLGLFFAVRTYSSSQSLLFQVAEGSTPVINSAALILACLLIVRSLFRAGHFEVNVYPSQSVLHRSLTLFLAGAYLVVVGVLSKVVALLGGDAAMALRVFCVLAGLAVLAMLLLSDRLQLHFQRFVSRHFQRPLYDYRAIWKTFTEGTAHCVEQAELCQAIVKLTSSIFQALSVTVWLVDQGKQELLFGASTFLSESKAAQLRGEPADALPVIQALSQRSEPMDLDASKEAAASILRRLHPEEFHRGSNRICAPMLAGGELIGFLILGDRVGGVQFGQQDLDLVKAVSDQSAANLMTARLLQRLAQARQLEAFQAMSAFFVHDLKNTASTLSLMLQNLPVHFQDPQFREDALRSVGKTVAHIKELISRLSLLRQELVVKPVPTDLNRLVETALQCLGTTSGVEVIKQLEPLPKAAVDPAQIENVFTNLVLNARDALGPGGRICARTWQRQDWVAVSINDNGCGMSPEFIHRSLFRPFQTTKKKGLGIGMYQCKMVVEAHRGRIDVESQPGQGTTFTVLLPLALNRPPANGTLETQTVPALAPS